MSLWSSILESFHSSLVDELNHRREDLRPELGLPIRQTQLKSPAASGSLSILHAQVFGEPGGVVLLASDRAALEFLGVQRIEELWSGMSARTPQEFDRRKIRPRLGVAMMLKEDWSLPPGVTAPKRVIWIPFGIDGGRVYLGVGV
jgi:hypothetical protein